MDCGCCGNIDLNNGTRYEEAIDCLRKQSILVVLKGKEEREKCKDVSSIVPEV